MADNASPKTEPRNQRNAGNNRPLGMVISKLKPLSSEFYTHFHEKNRAFLRQFNAISNAIYNIFRLVEGDQATSTKVQKWLSGVYDELSGNVNTFKEQIDKNVARLPLDDSSFEGFDYGEFEIRWNHPMTYKLLDIIQTINVLTRQAHQLWLYGQISQQVHDRIILQLLSSLRVAMDNITKILNAENRVGSYSSLTPLLRPQSVNSRIQPGSDVIVCAEMDEQWGYVGAKSRQRWLFYAYDRIRKTVVAHVSGERTLATLATLERLPGLLSAFEVVVWMTDDWPLYESRLKGELHDKVIGHYLNIKHYQ